MLIDLLTHSKAHLRFLGTDIFNNLGSQKFNGNILDLSPIKQYKLWVCLTQAYKEPKYIIPWLLPLIDSQSATVKQCFILKLKEYSENYGRLLTELLQKKLDTLNLNHCQIMQSIIDHMENHFVQNIYTKQGIRELDPYYSSNKILNDYDSWFNKKARKGIRGIEKTGFLAFSTTIILAKGGGWKQEDEDEIRKLKKIETKTALPRSYFINPNRYEMEEFDESYKDWKEDDFALIKKWIADE